MALAASSGIIEDLRSMVLLLILQLSYPHPHNCDASRAVPVFSTVHRPLSLGSARVHQGESLRFASGPAAATFPPEQDQVAHEDFQ
jgi:hypothetical protein